jgi:excisionase family DNA binding protein
MMGIMNKRLVNKKELAQYLNLSIYTIDAWVSQNRIPFVKMGSRVLFDLVEIDKWIEKQKVASKESA